MTTTTTAIDGIVRNMNNDNNGINTGTSGLPASLFDLISRLKPVAHVDSVSEEGCGDYVLVVNPKTTEAPDPSSMSSHESKLLLLREKASLAVASQASSAAVADLARRVLQMEKDLSAVASLAKTTTEIVMHNVVSVDTSGTESKRMAQISEAAAAAPPAGAGKSPVLVALLHDSHGEGNEEEEDDNDDEDDDEDEDSIVNDGGGPKLAVAAANPKKRPAPPRPQPVTKKPPLPGNSDDGDDIMWF